MLNEFDSIIFDLDGTLFQTDKLVVPAFDATIKQLRNEGFSSVDLPKKEDILSVVGLTTEKIWNILLPNLPEDFHEKANKILLENELSSINDGYGALYPGVIETLIELKNRGYRLFIASNGLKEYVYGVTNAFRINHLFEAMYSAGEFNTNIKTDLVKKLILDYKINKAAMVGDRSSDVEAGIGNNLYVIGCDFGFSSKNELENANTLINEFTQLLDIIK